MLMATKVIEYNFGLKKDGYNWTIINDSVMGGLTNSTATFTDNTILFKGDLSLENNGGFASLKSPFSTYDLSYFNTISIKYKTKGQTLAITLEPHKVFYKPYYKLILPQTNTEWKTLVIDINEFKSYRMGRGSDDRITEAILAKIKRIGFITSDKKAGAFEIEIDYIKFNN